MKKIIFIIIIVAVIGCYFIFHMSSKIYESKTDIIIESPKKSAKVIKKKKDIANDVNSNTLFSNLKNELQTEQSKLNFSNISNNLIKPYTAMKNKISNDAEQIISLKNGLPEYLTEEEVEIREKAFDVYNKLPPEIQYWSSIDKDYIALTNSVLRKNEIAKIIELNKEDWENLITIADRLLYGIDAYKDIPAARKILEYVWQNCPPDVNLDNEYWKYTGLQYLAQSYATFSGNDNYNKNIELFNLLDSEFTSNYEVGKNNYISPYFWPGIVQRAYSYTMLDDYSKVDDIYNRFDEAYINYQEEAPLIKKSINQLTKIGAAIANYHNGKIDKNNLIIILSECGGIFDEIANDPITNHKSKQKNIIDKEQVYNIIEYLKEEG